MAFRNIPLLPIAFAVLAAATLAPIRSFADQSLVGVGAGDSAVTLAVFEYAVLTRSTNQLTKT